MASLIENRENVKVCLFCPIKTHKFIFRILKVIKSILGHEKIVSLLIQTRANLSQSNVIGNTPLIAAIVTGMFKYSQ